MRLAIYSNSFGSGKSTFAECIQENNPDYTKLSLATKLKEKTHQYLEKKGIAYNPSDKSTIIHNDKSLRDYYILVGAKLNEKRGQNWFIDTQYGASDFIIVDDARQPHELEKLMELNYTPVFVDRLLPTPDKPLEGLLKFDYHNHIYIPNYGGKDLLQVWASVVASGRIKEPVEINTALHLVEFFQDAWESNIYNTQIEITISQHQLVKGSGKTKETYPVLRVRSDKGVFYVGLDSPYMFNWLHTIKQTLLT